MNHTLQQVGNPYIRGIGRNKNHKHKEVVLGNMNHTQGMRSLKTMWKTLHHLNHYHLLNLRVEMMMCYYPMCNNEDMMFERL
jgi:hypothetical protein